MLLIRSLSYQDNVDVNNRFAKLILDTDIETEYGIVLNGTDANGTYVQHNFIAVDNYFNSESVDIVIDDITASIPPFTKVIWQVHPLTQLLKVTANVGTVTVWISEKKLPIGEGVNEHGVDTVGSNVLRTNSLPALQAISNPKQDFAAYLTARYLKGLFVFDVADHSADVTADPAQGIFVAPLSDLTGASGAWVRDFTTTLNTWWFGAVPDLLLNGSMSTPNPAPTDSGIAVVRAIAMSKYMFENASIGGDYYKGGPEVITPPGGYWANVSTFNLLHMFKFRGFGDGQDGPGAGGVTHFKWAPNVPGIITQFPNTSSVLAVDGVTHDGYGGGDIEDMMLEGQWVLGVNEDGDFDAIVLRGITRVKNIYAKNWQGRAVRAWAGNISAGGNISGNVSTSRLDSVKGEGCLGGLDIDGSEASIIEEFNCTWYQNRQFGRRTVNGAGGGASHGCHCASNGMISNIGKYTQTSLAGERYGVASKTANTLNPPSGTTADTADWVHIEAGGAVANLIPAYVATPGLFRFGGDYISEASDSTTYYNPYSEGGTMSFFNFGAIIINPVMANQYFRGGVRLVPGAGALNVQSSGNTQVNIAHGGLEGDLQFMNLITGAVHAYIAAASNAGVWLLARELSGFNFRVGSFSVNTTPMTLDDQGPKIAATRGLYIGGIRVLDGQMAHIANIAGAPTAADYNALLAAFQGVKLMA